MQLYSQVDEYSWVKEVQQGFDDNCPEVQPSTCRVLYAAVLERAYRDLIDTDKTITPEEKEDAIDWFLSRDLDSEGISFDDCILYLDLTTQQIDYLNSIVLEALKDD